MSDACALRLGAARPQKFKRLNFQSVYRRRFRPRRGWSGKSLRENRRIAAALQQPVRSSNDQGMRLRPVRSPALPSRAGLRLISALSNFCKPVARENIRRSESLLLSSGSSHEHCCWHRSGAVGHQGQGPGPAGLQAARRPDARQDEGLLLGRRRRPADVVRDVKRCFDTFKMTYKAFLQPR